MEGQLHWARSLLPLDTKSSSFPRSARPTKSPSCFSCLTKSIPANPQFAPLRVQRSWSLDQLFLPLPCGRLELLWYELLCLGFALTPNRHPPISPILDLLDTHLDPGPLSCEKASDPSCAAKYKHQDNRHPSCSNSLHRPCPPCYCLACDRLLCCSYLTMSEGDVKPPKNPVVVGAVH